MNGGILGKKKAPLKGALLRKEGYEDLLFPVPFYFIGGTGRSRWGGFNDLSSPGYS